MKELRSIITPKALDEITPRIKDLLKKAEKKGMVQHINKAWELEDSEDVSMYLKEQEN